MADETFGVWSQVRPSQVQLTIMRSQTIGPEIRGFTVDLPGKGQITLITLRPLRASCLLLVFSKYYSMNLFTI